MELSKKKIIEKMERIYEKYKIPKKTKGVATALLCLERASNKSVAQETGIASASVAIYKTQIFAKVGVENTNEMIKFFYFYDLENDQKGGIQ